MVETLQDPSFSTWLSSQNPLQPLMPEFGRSSSTGSFASRAKKDARLSGGSAFSWKCNSWRKDPRLPLSMKVTVNSCEFKISPTILAYSGRGRPFVGRCCTCMPNSRSELYHDRYQRAGMQDIFKLPTMGSENHWLTRTFSILAFVLKRIVPGDYPELSHAVLSSSRVQDAIRGNGDNHRVSNGLKMDKKTAQRAKAVIRRMRSDISKHLIRFTAWFLHKFLSCLLSAIVVNKGQMQMISQASKKDLPLIFLPTHRSHLDYILITFILVNYDIRPPHVAAGDNLLIPVFGSLMRGLGGFFIRRRLDKKAGEKDRLYRAILQMYMEELLKRGENMEFYIEGGRTRSGKAGYPKGGLLSVIVDAVLDGSVPDAMLVPVSISYDKLLDGNFNREQMGLRKNNESFWRAMRGIWNTLSSQYGYVRVDFGQPFSLQEYLRSARSTLGFNSRQPSLDGSSSPGSDRSERAVGWSAITEDRSASELSLYGCGIVRDDQVQLVQSLAEHIIHSQTLMQPVMSTHLVSFICLTLSRKGSCLSEICTHYDWLKQMAIERGRDIGVTGETEDIVRHAIQLLEPLVKKSHKSINNNTVKCKENPFVEPVMQLPQIFELSHYANSVVPIFACESILANALHSHIDPDAWLHPEEGIKFYKEAVMGTAVNMCNLLKYEFIFSPPCSTLTTSVEDAFAQLIAADILSKKEEFTDGLVSEGQKEWSKRLAASLAMNDGDSEEDDDWCMPSNEYSLNISARNLHRLHFLQSVVSPLLETYYITACKLSLLMDHDLPEDNFTNEIHSVLKDRVQQGLATYAESAALDTVRNAVRGLQHAKLLRKYTVANVAMLELVPEYKDEAKIQEFLHSVGLHLGVPLPQS